MGAICSECGGDMLEVASCALPDIELVDGTYQRIRWGDEKDDWGSGRCGDCGVQPNGIHHFGCDIEQCPRCSDQLRSCDCMVDEGA